MGNVMESLVAEVLTALEPRLAGAGVRVTSDYPDGARDMPPGRGVVAVGLQEATAVPCALCDYLGADENGRSLYGRTLEATLSLLVCVPPAEGGAGCRRVFGLLCEALLFDMTAHDVQRVWCAKTAYQKELGALVLPCCAKLRVQLARSDEGGGVTGFEIRRVTT